MSEPSFEELYQHAPCGHLSTDSHDVILAVNETFLEWSGYARAEIMGRRFRDLLVTSSQIFYETRYQSVLLLGGEAREVALELMRADGSRMPILVNARVFPQGPGGSSIRLAVFDSTERQSYERDLLSARREAELSEARVSTMQDASIVALAADSEESLAEALAEIARRAFAASDAAVVVANDVGSMRVIAGGHLLPTLLKLQAARPEGRARVGADVDAVGSLQEAAAISPAIADILRSIRAEAVTATPLVGVGGVLGSLVLFYGRAREFDEGLFDLQKGFARQASLALDRIRLQRELERMALHDQLTGLANRSLLRERLSHALALAERSRCPMALIFLDLDGFKAVNDELGHRVGDAVLQTIAGRVAAVIREADIVGRYGGDEFVIVCEDVDADAATLVAERVAAVVAEPMSDIEGGPHVSASIGVALFRPGERPLPSNDTVVRAADAAMYESKNAGPGRITLVNT